jgi:hypothetical protein
MYRGTRMDKSVKRFKKGAKYVNIVSAVTRDQLTSINSVSDESWKEEVPF